MLRITSCALILLGGCGDIDGTKAGGPCNSQGVCVSGLLCEEGVCKDQSELQWETMSVPADTDLNGVFGTDANNVFAVGAGGVILRYPGQGMDWVDTKQADLTGVKGTLRDIWGVPGSLWAVGDKAILRWNGTAWATQNAFDAEATYPTQLQLRAVHGASATQAYAVGYESSGSTAHVIRLNGSTWDDVPNVDLSFQPQGLWVTSANHLFVVGTARHVKYFDGTTWSEQNLPATQSLALSAIWGTTDGRAYAVGPSGTLATYDGSAWSVESDRRASFVAHDLYGLSSTDLFIVGSSSSYSGTGGIERCTSVCAANPVPEAVKSKTLRGIWITPDNGTVFVVGDDGTILRRKLK